MKMSGTFHLDAPLAVAWRCLNDPPIIRAAIPGCQSFEMIDPTTFRAAANVAVGPVRSVFSGTFSLSDIDPPKSYRVAGEGQSTTGTAAGTAFVRLAPNDQGTDIHYEVEASVGGKIAQISQRFIDQAAKKMAEDFLLRFSALVEKELSAAKPAQPSYESSETRAENGDRIPLD